MYVIRLPDGTLRVPHSVVADAGEADAGEAGVAESGADVGESGAAAREGRIIADAYVEIGPDDPDYDRLLHESLTEEELADRRRRWRDEDADLLRRFEEWKAGDPQE
ncbi:hypothetical protein E1293_33300 [Actinomadura darangshiensis]|uniref:Uncharacterized protein n=1 Tax=Actinomadura darangshiensis TaxID=705336 RepID=A0A4R5AJY6_9ACTN|nr:hypothetical protein [Actinomadura darangshiensis]TDD71826.1 hypothetical protein E1293_33300 [Actinomadura darangshiensis]